MFRYGNLPHSARWAAVYLNSVLGFKKRGATKQNYGKKDDLPGQSNIRNRERKTLLKR